MKKLLAAILCLSFLLVGCSQPDNRSTDEKFIDALKSGLVARWKIADDNSALTPDYDNLAKAELNYIESFKDEDFENKELQKLVKDYVDLIEQTQEISSLAETNYDAFSTQYNQIYYERLNDLRLINDINKLEFEQSNDQKNMDDLLYQADVNNAVEELKEKFQFELADEHSDTELDYYYATYEAIVTNDTDIAFNSFNGIVNEIGEDSVIFEQGYINADNWKPGETRKFDLFVDQPVKDFSITEITYSDSVTQNYQTIKF